MTAPRSSETLACLLAYPWPGNIREQRNEIARALVPHEGRQQTPADSSSCVLPCCAADDLRKAVPQSGTLAERLDVIEAMVLREASAL